VTVTGPDLGDLVPWVKQHSRLSVHMLRRRFPISADEATVTIADLIRLRVLSPVPEGESYRVRYRQRRREEPAYFNSASNYGWTEPR